MNESIFVSEVLSGNKVSFARFGDGEFFCIAGRNGNNCDGHKYYPDLGERLKEVLLNSPVTKGFQPLARTLGLTKQYEHIQHLNADVFHEMSKRGEFWPVIEHLRGQDDVLVVGQKHHAHLLNSGNFIEIPAKNCWIEYDTTRARIGATENEIIILCASMMGTVLVDDFRHRHQVMDMGSVFEPYCGRVSRAHHNQVRLREGIELVRE